MNTPDKIEQQIRTWALLLGAKYQKSANQHTVIFADHDQEELRVHLYRFTGWWIVVTQEWMDDDRGPDNVYVSGRYRLLSSALAKCEKASREFMRYEDECDDYGEDDEGQWGLHIVEEK